MGMVLSGELALGDDVPFGYDRVGDKFVPNGDADLVRKVFEAYLLYAERPSRPPRPKLTKALNGHDACLPEPLLPEELRHER